MKQTESRSPLGGGPTSTGFSWNGHVLLRWEPISRTPEKGRPKTEIVFQFRAGVSLACSNVLAVVTGSCFKGAKLFSTKYVCIESEPHMIFLSIAMLPHLGGLNLGVVQCGFN